jgi:hypothetical protein
MGEGILIVNQKSISWRGGCHIRMAGCGSRWAAAYMRFCFCNKEAQKIKFDGQHSDCVQPSKQSPE